MPLPRVLRHLLAAALVAAGPLSAPAFAAGPAGIVPTLAPSHLLVRFQPGLGAAARDAALRTVGVHADLVIEALGVARVALPANLDPLAAIARLRAEPMVAGVEVDSRASAGFIPNDPLWSDDPYSGVGEWGLRKAHVEEAWDEARGSSDIVVATIDTGVDPGHPDLAGALLPGATFVSSPDAVCPSGDVDDNSHGTHVAGLIAAGGNNGRGIAGVAFGVRILPIKALDCTGSGSISDIAQAIVWATDHGARIANISLGTAFNSAVLEAAVGYALARNVLLIAAVGNCGAAVGRCLTANRPEYPAAYPGVLAVGATDMDDVVTTFSTRGTQVAIAAPGVRMVSTTPRYPTYLSDRGLPMNYASLSGTSQSSALVAGVAALVWSARPELTARQIADRLVGTADDLGDPGRDDAYGAGRVNALRAVQPGSTVVHFASSFPSEFARKIAIDAAVSDLGRVLRGPLLVYLVTGEVITLR